MRKDPHLIDVSPQNSIRDFILKYPTLRPIVEIVGISRPYGSTSIHEACKGSATHESVLMALLAACLSDQPHIPASLPSYGLLQFCKVVNGFAEHVEDALCHLSENDQFEQLETLKKAFLLHKKELQTLLLPHIEHVYELYYSPEYTSQKNNLMPYSMDFFPSNELPFNEWIQWMNVIEVQGNWNVLQQVYQVYESCVVLKRMETGLLKPLVLQMESEIILSFQRKIERLKRMTYLPVSNSVVSSDSLTKREREVLTYVASGLLNKEIAEQMNISLTTVISHRKNIVKKLHINTMAGLTIYAYTHGYLVHLPNQSEVGV